MPREFLWVLLLPAVYYFSALLHEAGHAVCGWLAGATPTSFGMGTGRLFLVVPLGRTRLFFGLQQPLQGIAFSLFPQLLPARRNAFAFSAGGIVANAFGATLFFGFAAAWPAAKVFWLICAGWNGFVAVINLIPVTVKVGQVTARSDGASMLGLVRGSERLDPAQFLRTFAGLTELWRSAGDWRALHTYSVGAAAVWLQLGDPERARQLLVEAGALPGERLVPHRAYETYIRSLTALEMDERDETSALLLEAEADFRSLDHPVGLLLCALARGRLLHRCGDVAAAVACYETLATNRALAGRPELCADVHLAQCLARCDLPDGGGTVAAITAYEARPARVRTPLSQLQVYKEAAKTFLKEGKPEPAASAHSQALAAAASLDATFADADRDCFRLAQSRWIAEAQACLRGLGREEEAARLDDFFPSPEQLKCRAETVAEEARRTRHRWMLRWGFGLLLFNVVVVALAVVISFLAEPSGPPAGEPVSAGVAFRRTFDQHFGFWGLILAMLLIFWTTCAAAFGLPLALAGCWLPRMRRVAAGAVFLSAILPWLTWGFSMLFIAAIVAFGFSR